MEINKILKVLFILVAFWFLISLVSLPKTNCQACEIEYEGNTIDGYEAFEIFERGCLSYAKPWNNNPPPKINLNKTESFIS